MKIFIFVTFVFVLLYGDFSTAGAQSILDVSVFEQSREDSNNFNFQPLPEDPGVEVAPLPESQTEDMNDPDKSDEIISVVTDDEG